VDVLNIIYEAFHGSITSVFQIAKIVIPLMVIMQFIKELKLFEKFSGLITPVIRVLGISKYASLPLLAGLFLGISYGGGVIIHSAREGLLTKRDLYLTIIFLSICHSLFEDNFLFIAIGADPYILFIGRFALAVVVTFLISRVWKEGKRAVGEENINPLVTSYYKSFKE